MHIFSASRSKAISALCVLGALGVLPSGSVQARMTHTEAGMAQVQSLSELVHMSVVSKKGNKIVAQGSASGTIRGSMVFSLVLLNGSQAAGSFTASNAHGTIHGRDSATYTVSGVISRFSGTVVKMGGTGSYAHVHSLGLAFSGTINRETNKVTFQLRGKWRV